MRKFVLFYIFITVTLGGCDIIGPAPEENISFSTASSIILNNGKVCISGYAYNKEVYSTKYWVDDEPTDAASFINLIPAGSYYEEAIDEAFMRASIYKNFNNEIDEYRFDQGILADEGKLFYYKNNVINKMDTTAVGTVSSVFVSPASEYFAGYFGEIILREEGEVLIPKTPFFWDRQSKPVVLQVPAGLSFRGISTIYTTESNDIYVGGLMNSPMYWKNSVSTVLNSLYGQIMQIIVSGTDVYAVGFYNKSNSNSTGHTAAYWKNGELIELEDDAQAHGIYLDGNDVYISGSIGRVPVEYKACYWVNGVRIDLPN